MSGSEKRKAAFVLCEVVVRCSHSACAVIHPFSLSALNVGRFIENKWRADKEPSTMAAGAELTRTAVG